MRKILVQSARGSVAISDRSRNLKYRGQHGGGKQRGTIRNNPERNRALCFCYRSFCYLYRLAFAASTGLIGHRFVNSGHYAIFPPSLRTYKARLKGRPRFFSPLRAPWSRVRRKDRAILSLYSRDTGHNNNNNVPL